MRPVHNPPNPFDSIEREWLEAPPAVALEVYEQRAQSILSENSSPDLPFRWSVNPYRGCFHACAYCYARPTHEYLGFGAGTDFESKIVVKSNAPDLLRAAFERSSWHGELVVFSGNTDCYQPLEATWRLTRRCLEVCAAYRNPVGIITKAALVQRDIEVLLQLHARAAVRVYFSIPYADDETGRAVEPQAPVVSRRFEALRRLSQAGVPTGVSLAPVIPGLNDDDIAPVLERAREAGATRATYTLLRLSGSVRDVFLGRIAAALPDRARRIENRIREVRGGALSDSRFHARQRGQGVYWDMIHAQFALHTRRLGFDIERVGNVPDRTPTFRRPGDVVQGSLFDEDAAP
jgi:DNA repair photolyase